MTRLITMGTLALLAVTARSYADDKKFIMEAASGGKLEVMLGQLATQNADSPDVKKFGERLITDHSKANKELMAIAETKQIEIPAALDSKCQACYDKLKALKGAEFDKAFMTHMIKDHEEDITAFMKEANDGQDEQIKGFAAKTLPTLKEHLQMSKEVATKVGATNK